MHVTYGAGRGNGRHSRRIYQRLHPRRPLPHHTTFLSICRWLWETETLQVTKTQTKCPNKYGGGTDGAAIHEERSACTNGSHLCHRQCYDLWWIVMPQGDQKCLATGIFPHKPNIFLEIACSPSVTTKTPVEQQLSSLVQNNTSKNKETFPTFQPTYKQIINTSITVNSRIYFRLTKLLKIQQIFLQL